MANPQKAWKAEYAKSARSSCKTCKSIIDKEILRLGKMVQAKQFDGFMPMWNHASCILKKANQIKFIADVEGIESLRWEDQQRIRKYVEEGGGGGGNDDSSGPPGVKAAKDMEYGIELSQTSRAHCKGCSEKIMKGEVRVSTKPDGQGPRGLAWHHANCFMDLYPSVQVDKLSGWESLAAPDQAAVHSLVKKVPSTAETGIKNEGKEDEKLQQSSSKAGAKRRKDTSGDQKSKVAKFKGDVPTSSAAFAKNDSELDSKLESQSKELWALKDDLKKHVTTVELRSMLEANSQISNGSELDLRDRCADGMIFGALGCCSMCSGSLHYSGGMYRCGGYLSEWSKCSYSTCEPARLKGKWKIPEETDNQYLIKWFKSQKRNKPVRILAPLSSNNLSGSQATSSQSQSSKSENLGDLKAAVSGLPKESLKEWKGKIEAAGGQLHAKIKKGSNDRTVNSEEV